MPKGNIVLIDVTVSFITTQLQWQEPTDITVQPQNSNGIKKASIIRLSNWLRFIEV